MYTIKSHQYPDCVTVASHNHTTASIFDSNATAKKYMEVMVEKGRAYGLEPKDMTIAITNHGVLYDVENNKAAAKEIGVNYVLGVEAYYMDHTAIMDKRMHLILIAKDEIGAKAISLAVTASNGKMDSKGFPRMDDEILMEQFGPDSIGHEHVFATSACVSGVLSSIILENAEIEKEIEKLNKKMSHMNRPDNPAYINTCKKIDEINDRLAEISKTLPSVDKKAKTSFIKKEKTLKTYFGTPEYEEKKAEFDAEKQEAANAAVEAENLRSERTSLKLKLRHLKDGIKPFENDAPKFQHMMDEITTLKNGIVSDEELYQKAINQAKHFTAIFGKEYFYCELQNHGLKDEAIVMPIIAKIAKELHLHVVAANDAHMVSNSTDEQKTRQLIRGLRFGKYEDAQPADAELYLKTDAELAKALNQILDDDTVIEAMEGTKTMLNQCHIEFTTAHHYPKFPVSNGENAVARLRRLATEGIAWRYPDGKGWTKEHEERMEYELGVIEKLGFCDYLCIVEDFLRYGRLLGKIDINSPEFLNDPYNIDNLKHLAEGHVGIGIGPGRGSAVGSLVCYLVGITGLDPMKYGLIFERFLNVERVTMPDIDSDFKTDIRDKVIDYVKHVYGPEAVCCIMTRGTQAAKGSIRSAARLLGSQKFDDTARFLSLGDAMAKKVPTEVGIHLKDCREELVSAFGENSDAMEILNNAFLLEGAFTSVGMHAAGVIIADNGDVKQYVPLLWNKDKEQWVAQCEKEPCEANGLLKMDFLGLKNLNIITETLKRIQANYGKSIDIEKIPFEPEVFAKIYSAGNTNSVFQFESGGMKKMLRQFQPETIEDIILLVAAYRPGPMQYLDDIIAVKHHRKTPEYVIPEMESVLGQTYGYPVYQEQIMQIFNKFAGFSFGEADIIRRYMSKKKTDKFAAYKDKFLAGIVARGADPVKAEDFWQQLVEFSKYAFNKSHATAYAVVSYYTAYLKYFYPKEYLCAVMNDTEFEKLGGLIADCKGFGIKVYPADINFSSEKFDTKKDGIVVGLGTIKSVGNSAETIIAEREANGLYTSFADFMLRTSCNKSVAENLTYAGAFDEFTENRQALVDAVPEYCDILKKIKAKAKIIDEPCDETDTKAMARKERAQNAYNELIENMKSIAINIHGSEDYLTRLSNEKDKVGAFVSGHPLDTYGQPADFKCTAISDIEAGRNVRVMGMITNLRVVQRKSDGANLAFFTLEDQTGTISVNCFTQVYAEYKENVVADSVVIISGDCMEDIDNVTDEKVLKINAKKFQPLEMKQKSIVISVESPMDWEDRVYDMIKVYRSKNGAPLVVFDKMNGKFRKTDITVSSDIFTLTDLNPQQI